MNKALGIVKDKDVRTAETGASQKDIRDWVEGNESATTPSINPMRIDWVGHVKSPWNCTVFAHFCQHMQSRVDKVPGNIPPPSREELREMFFNRVRRLRTIVLSTKSKERMGMNTEEA